MLKLLNTRNFGVSIVTLLITLCLATVVIGSCTSGSEQEKEAVLHAVKRYNNLLQRTYMEANIDLLKDIATQAEINRVFPVIMALLAQGYSMRTDQETFLVKGVSVSGEKAYVETEETWVYWWQDAKTNAITKPEETITYKIKYHLVRGDNTWRVDGIENIE